MCKGGYALLEGSTGVEMRGALGWFFSTHYWTTSCENRGVGGKRERVGVQRVVAGGSVRARSSLISRLGGTKFGMARTAISESVGRLRLMGIPLVSKECGCDLPTSRHFGPLRGLGQGLVSTFIEISATKRLLMVGALPNGTVTVNTLVSGLS